MKIATIDTNKIKKEMEESHGREIQITDIEWEMTGYRREFLNGTMSDMELYLHELKVRAKDLETGVLLIWYTDPRRFIKGGKLNV